MAEDKYAWDLDAAEDALIALTAEGRRSASPSGTTRSGCPRKAAAAKLAAAA